MSSSGGQLQTLTEENPSTPNSNDFSFPLYNGAAPSVPPRHQNNNNNNHNNNAIPSRESAFKRLEQQHLQQQNPTNLQQHQQQQFRQQQNPNSQLQQHQQQHRPQNQHVPFQQQQHPQKQHQQRQRPQQQMRSVGSNSDLGGFDPHYVAGQHQNYPVSVPIAPVSQQQQQQHYQQQQQHLIKPHKQQPKLILDQNPNQNQQHHHPSVQHNIQGGSVSSRIPSLVQHSLGREQQQDTSRVPNVTRTTPVATSIASSNPASNNGGTAYTQDQIVSKGISSTDNVIGPLSLIEQPMRRYANSNNDVTEDSPQRFLQQFSKSVIVDKSGPPSSRVPLGPISSVIFGNNTSGRGVHEITDIQEDALPDDVQNLQDDIRDLRKLRDTMYKQPAEPKLTTTGPVSSSYVNRGSSSKEQQYQQQQQHYQQRQQQQQRHQQEHQQQQHQKQHQHQHQQQHHSKQHSQQQQQQPQQQQDTTVFLNNNGKPSVQIHAQSALSQQPYSSNPQQSKRSESSNGQQISLSATPGNMVYTNELRFQDKTDERQLPSDMRQIHSNFQQRNISEQQHQQQQPHHQHQQQQQQQQRHNQPENGRQYTEQHNFNPDNHQSDPEVIDLDKQMRIAKSSSVSQSATASSSTINTENDKQSGGGLKWMSLSDSDSDTTSRSVVNNQTSEQSRTEQYISSTYKVEKDPGSSLKGQYPTMMSRTNNSEQNNRTITNNPPIMSSHEQKHRQKNQPERSIQSRDQTNTSQSVVDYTPRQQTSHVQNSGQSSSTIPVPLASRFNQVPYRSPVKGTNAFLAEYSLYHFSRVCGILV